MNRVLGLTRVLGSYVPSGETGIRFCCPFCERSGKSPDRKFHLHAYFNTEIFVCYRCGKSGEVSWLYKLYNLQEDSFSTISLSEKLAQFLMGDVAEPMRKVTVFAKIPHGFSFVYKGHPAYNYLLKRGLSEDDIAYYGFGISPEFPNSVLACDFDKKGNFLFYQARYFGSNPLKMRYKNPPGVDKNILIYNYYRAFNEPEIILTEGVYSAISAGRNAVATYGKKVSTQQIEMINAMPASRLYLCLDTDASRESYNLGMRLMENKEVYFITLPKDKDPNDIGKEAFQRYLKGAVPFTPLSGIRMFVQ